MQFRRQVRSVERERMGLLDEWPQGLGQAQRDARRERADEQRARRQYQGVIDLARAGDLPLAPGVLEAALAGLFGLL